MSAKLVVMAAVGIMIAYLDLTWTHIIVIVLGLFGLLAASIISNQNQVLYQPLIYPEYKAPAQNPPGFRTPREHDMLYEEVVLTTSDGERLAAWFMHQEEPRHASCTLVFFHGNAGNRGFRLPNFAEMYKELGCNIFAIDYRGYAESTGTPDEEGLVLDAEAAFDWVMRCPRIDPSTVIVFGRSLGGAVALALAEHHDKEMRALVVENTFTGIAEMVDKVLPYLAPLKSCFLRIHWKSRERMEHVRCPVLVLSGMLDEIVPNDMPRQLYDCAQAASFRRLVRFPGGTHNETWSAKGYTRELKAFLDRVLKDES